MAFPSDKGPTLCEFAIQDFQPEVKDDDLCFVSMGSGQAIADPFLGFVRRVFWQDGPPTVQEGVFATHWVLEHAIELNAGGINGPPQIAVLEKKPSGVRASLVDADRLMEHQSHREAAEENLRDFMRKQHGGGGGSAPSLPASPSGGASKEVQNGVRGALGKQK